MGKVVFLKLERGDFNQGFQVTLDIAEEGKFPYVIGVSGSLRRAPEIPQLYRDWQTKYRNLELSDRRKRLYFTKATDAAEDGDQQERSLQECYEAAEKLKDCFQNWLQCTEFRIVEEELLTNLSKSEDVQVILQTEDDMLRKLPWDAWSFLQRFRNADLSISSLFSHSHQQRVVNLQKATSSQNVKILAILGNSEGIDIQSDKEILENLPLANTCFLVEPTREQFKRLWEDAWDILFFAGHSSSEEGKKGYICVNRTDQGRLEIGELEETLQTAVDNGLKLAIFNSCDGLGLARQLERLHIPQVIVMREPVPDKIAQEFLKYFLTGLSQGASLYAAVRRARRILRELLQVDREFPGSSWLPVICQNPTAKGFVWPSPPIKHSWRESLIEQLQHYGWIAIASGLMGGAIAFLLTRTSFPKSPSFVKTDKHVVSICCKDLDKTGLVIGFLTSPHQNLPPKDNLEYALANYLKNKLGDHVQNTYEYDDNIRYRDTQKKIANKEWDIVFAYSPMNSWVAQSNGYTFLGRKESSEGVYYHSVLFVRSDSPIRTIADIKPTTVVALGYIGSASSFHIPIYNLYGKRLSVNIEHSHEKIQELVRSGEADVGASHSMKIEGKPEWRIIHRSQAIPVAGVFISPNLSESDQNRIKQVFRQLPDGIKQQLQYRESKEIDYKNIGKISSKTDEIMRCAHYFAKNPVQLFCQK